MSKKLKNREGYIYIYKCIVGNHMDICKIGRTKHLKDNMDRMKQHSRTPYYGFIPYCDFSTGNPISTAFKVKDMTKSDRAVQKKFKEFQLSGLEIYNIDYDDAIMELYNYLNEIDQFIEIEKDGISRYDFIETEEDDKEIVDTSKASFEKIKQKILQKYPKKLPDQLLLLLKNKKEFKENCSSHFKSGNYVDFPDNLVLDIHYNKLKRTEILNKLLKLL